eukprot:57812_1
MATLSKYLSLKTTDSSLGRYWIANEDIPSGTLLIKESPIACIPNCQIINDKVTDPIANKANSLCWNCCSLFPSTASGDNHYCSASCKSVSTRIIDILLDPSLPFNQSISNESTLRLTTFMMLKMVDYCIQNDQLSLLSNIDQTFTAFTKTPSKFYNIFTSNIDTNTPSLLLQHTIDSNMDQPQLYQSYVSTLSGIIPSLIEHLKVDINEQDMAQLSIYLLNIVFINAFGIRYSVVHDTDTLGLCVFEHTSLFNHSCCPNALYHFTDGNEIIVRTLRAIAKGESITISIVNDLECHAKAQRQHMISTHFGFDCLCSRCVDEEYVDNDELLAQRMSQKECVMNGKEHQNLLKFARSNWKNTTATQTMDNAWKFYKRLWNEYRYHYHPFDPDVLSLLEEMSQKAFMIKDYQIGYDAAELGREFAVRLPSCGVMEHCHLMEFKFIFLSFVNYLHLVKNECPQHDIEKIMNTQWNGDSVVRMNDDILAQMFEDEDGAKEKEKVSLQGAKSKKNKSKSNRNKHKQKHKKQKQKVSPKRKKKSKGKKKGNDGRKENDVRVYTFGCVESKHDEEECLDNGLQYELNEKIIEFFATRSILFPTFEDFELWIGKDLMILDQRIKHVVTSLKDKFDENASNV